VIEYRKADKDGRVPLSQREYYAIRAIYGAVNALSGSHGELERRTRTYANGWRDLRLLVKLSEKVLRDVLKTVPIAKLKQMQKELDNTFCEVKTRGVVGATEGYTYIDEKALTRICLDAMEINCFGCTIKHDAAKHNCQLYRDIQAVFNYDFDSEESGICPLAEGETE